ncbi:hypothetical protein CEQ28_008105 [Hafnia alvei]|nr:hypothetical protein CEQ28_008105 [Hafnia alvei]
MTATATYYSIPTDIGAAAIANAIATNVPLNLTDMAVGDGGGVYVQPDPTQVALVNECYRTTINSLSINADDSQQVIAEMVIPENIGGFTEREIGIFDGAGNLIVVANCAAIEKTDPATGSPSSQVIRLPIAVSDTSAVTLLIDPSSVLVTQQYVDIAIEESEEQAEKTYLAIENNFSEIATAGADAVTAAQTNIGLSPQVLGDDLTPGRVLLAGCDHFTRLLYLDDGSGDPINAVLLHVVNDTDPATGNPIPTVLSYAHTDTAEGQEVREQGERVFSKNNKPDATKDVTGLGTAATHNVQTSPTDNTSGAVLTVGAFGLGGDSIAVATTSNSDLHHLPGLPFNAIREYKSSDGSTYIIGIGGLSDDGNLAEWLAPETGADGTKLAVRNKTTLFTIYSDMNKPSATDNDFVSKANGGTYGGPLTITSDASALTLQNKNAGKSLYLAAKTSAGDNYWFIGGGSDGNQNIAFHNYIGNAAITLGSDGVITLTDYSTFDSRYVTGTRFGANKTTTWGGQGGTLPAGCAMTGGNFDDDTEYPIYAYLQYCINGTWINATGGVGATNLVSATHYQAAPAGNISQLINLQPYSPVNPEFPLAQYYIDEQGFDWFEAAPKLSGTVFIAFDTVSGVIHQIADSRLPNTDAYSLHPNAMSVVGLDNIPDGCSPDLTWVYDGTQVYQDPELLDAKNILLNNRAYKKD